MSLFTLLQAVAFYFSLALFCLWALGFSLVCVALAWLPASARIECFFQKLIHWQANLLLRWLDWSGVVRVEYRGWENVRVDQTVVVANHPGLLDAFYLLARVPRGFCIFKRAIRRNPLLYAGAWRAGYLANDTGLGLVRGATQRIAKGATLVIFPEGTRSPRDANIGELRPGFAAIARRGRVPVQLVRISVDVAFLTKGKSWASLSRLPANVIVEAGPCLDPARFDSTQSLVEAVAAWFQGTSSPGEGLHAELTPRLASTLTAS
jgi:1-acyl-sn-glycerol-3-phosphate acyltransferase